MTEEEEKELRSGCWCADTRKPCTYHEGWLDGYEHGQRARAMQELVEETERLGLYD